MTNGETRKAISESFDKTGKALTGGAENVIKGVRNLIVDFGKNTVDAILKPQTIPQKLEQCFDIVAVQPVHRTFEFFDESTNHALSEIDNTFRKRIKKAHQGAHRLKVVFAAPLEPITEGAFVPKVFPKSDLDNELIEAALMENFIFNHLSTSGRKTLIDAFEPIPYKKGKIVIKEGDVGDFFYVIGAGQVGFNVGGKDVGSAGPGQAFGELALLYRAPRAATCTAKTECGLFRLDQEHFRRILMTQAEDEVHDAVNCLKNVPYFKDLDDAYLQQIASNLSIHKFSDGEKLVRKGDDEIKFALIKEGTLKMSNLIAGGSEYKDMILGPGQFLGDLAIVQNTQSEATIEAVGNVTLLCLSKEVFVRVVGDDMTLMIQRTHDKRRLKQIPFGKRRGPAENELDLLVSSIVNKKYPTNHVFFTEGQRCIPTLYLVRSGRVEIRSSGMSGLEQLLGFSVGNGDSKVVGVGGYFGNDTLGHNEKGEFGVAKYTVHAIEDVELGVLDLNVIRSVVVKKDQLHEKITMEDLDMIRILGAGTFGKVWLVCHKTKNDVYALKVQGKKHLIDNNQVGGVISEKSIMAQLDHPFIIKMVSSWKDEDKLYMLMKLYQGGELQTIIHTNTRNGLPEWVAKFYAANILEGLTYMHHRHIIYRDLKPENVLLDSDGYTVIVDLGFAKIIKDKTYTFCGTPLYLAPEIIMQRGHDKGADHWSWGVMLYEMLVGLTPFYDGVVDQMGLFKNIVKGNYSFPDSVFISSDAEDLMKKILVVNPNNRLGSFTNAEKGIKSHKFFDDIDWKKLAAKNVKVPFKPKISDPLDGSNFDDYSTLEAQEKKNMMIKLTAREQQLFDEF